MIPTRQSLGRQPTIHFSGTNHPPDMTFLHAKKQVSSCVQIIWAGCRLPNKLCKNSIAKMSAKNVMKQKLFLLPCSLKTKYILKYATNRYVTSIWWYLYVSERSNHWFFLWNYCFIFSQIWHLAYILHRYIVLKNANSYLCLYCTFVLEIIAQSITFFYFKSREMKTSA